MIKPTVGRVVWFHPHPNEDLVANAAWTDPKEPFAAMIVYVWNERMVNLVVFSQVGLPVGRTSVKLLQDDDAKPEGGSYCEWMPYQRIQNEKTQELAKLVNEGQ